MSIAVIGAGNIGSAISLAFAAAGYEVRLCETNEEQRQAVRQRIDASVRDLREFGLIDQQSEDLQSRIRICAEIADAVCDAEYVQECVPEELGLKRELFAELDDRAPERAILASSSSAIPASEFAADLRGSHRCLVAHPGNPPFLIRVIEVVPAPFTSSEVTDRVCSLLRSAGMSPIVVRKEVSGFIFNRLQGALLREAYCLVRDGVAGVEDIDTIVRDGLGLRWAVVGPFETADLNRRGGIGAHANIMGAAYAAMGRERGQDDPWTPDLIRKVEAERRALLPLSRWEDRVRWRDRQLMSLLAARARWRMHG